MQKQLCLIFFVCLVSQGAPLPQTTMDKIVSSIYKIEGGDKTKYPFGIKSIDCKGDYSKARKICTNTVRNNWVRFSNLEIKERNKYHCFYEFLASKYCPPTADPEGYKNWIKNIHKMGPILDK